MIQDLRFKIQKFKKTIRYTLNAIRFERGFTLVEVLIVLTILLVIGSIIGTILFSSLRGANKTNTLSAVRQNGNYAITQISKIVRSANEYELSTDGILYASSCEVLAPPIPTPTPAVITKYNYLKITSDSVETIFFCNSNPDVGMIFQNGNPLISADSSSVKVCSFSCTKNNAFDTPTINIELILSQSGSGSFVENLATVSFNTSIALRNPQR